MKAVVCLGEYAKSSYCFDKLGLCVYSMEELCYCLKENAFLLGREIMHDKLLRFIDVECNVPQLARNLYSLVHQKGTLSAFVSLILEYVGFYDAETIREVENTIKNNSGLTDYEKRKLRIDFLAANGKYSVALEEYNDLIDSMESMEGMEGMGRNEAVLAATWHNKGVILASLFLYEEAAECFMRSYQIMEDEHVLKRFLLAKRMELPEKEYIALIAEMPHAYELSLQIEKQLEELEIKWQQSSVYVGLQNMKEWHDKGEVQRYEEECDQLIDALKEDYRNSI